MPLSTDCGVRVQRFPTQQLYNSGPRRGPDGGQPTRAARCRCSTLSIRRRSAHGGGDLGSGSLSQGISAGLAVGRCTCRLTTSCVLDRKGTWRSPGLHASGLGCSLKQNSVDAHCAPYWPALPWMLTTSFAPTLRLHECIAAPVASKAAHRAASSMERRLCLRILPDSVCLPATVRHDGDCVMSKPNSRWVRSSQTLTRPRLAWPQTRHSIVPSCYRHELGESETPLPSIDGSTTVMGPLFSH